MHIPRSGSGRSVQRLGEVPESSGADPEVRFRKVPVQRLGEVLQGSSADT